ncbi:hypothetical protein HMPREF1316_0975 [Olsenella profusa F0195]|uniref:Uncharacterized protein n=1 Tax=Olsenella profusa F0195 TaxID=1125712 RepID=U2V2P9_9ACTN|nr:hypothetical protein HMPREF1316_0975 [Olsenella profusa F0195]
MPPRRHGSRRGPGRSSGPGEATRPLTWARAPRPSPPTSPARHAGTGPHLPFRHHRPRGRRSPRPRTLDPHGGEARARHLRPARGASPPEDIRACSDRGVRHTARAYGDKLRELGVQLCLHIHRRPPRPWSSAGEILPFGDEVLSAESARYPHATH